MTSIIVTPTARQLRRKIRPYVWMLLIVFVSLLASTLLPRSNQNLVPYSINNPSKTGIQALARVLEKKGFEVKETSRVLEARKWINDGNAEGTLVIIRPQYLTTEMATALEDIPRVVAFGFVNYEIPLFPGLDPGNDFFIDSGSIGVGSTDSLTASIADRISVFNADALEVSSQWSTAFVSSVDASPRYAEQYRDGTYRAFVTQHKLLTNEFITLHGNASLALNAVTAYTTVPIEERGPIVFLHPDPAEQLSDPGAVIPPWMARVSVLFFVALVVYGFSRGQRFGRFIYEDVPSYVPAAETVTGKGRLLRQNNEVAHIATQLRRGTATRLARRLSVAPSSSQEALERALISAGASAESAAWLWAPTPTTLADLELISEKLAALEKEISR